MPAPSSDTAAIRQTLRALKASEVFVPVRVEYGDDDGEDVTNATEQETIDHITAVDDAFLIVERADGYRGWIRFVMGNSPEEVICNHTEDLSEVLDPLTRSWWEE